MGRLVRDHVPRLPVLTAARGSDPPVFPLRRWLVDPAVPLVLCWLGLAVAAAGRSTAGLCVVLAMVAGYSLSGST